MTLHQTHRVSDSMYMCEYSLTVREQQRDPACQGAICSANGQSSPKSCVVHSPADRHRALCLQAESRDLSCPSVANFMEYVLMRLNVTFINLDEPKARYAI